MNQKKLNSKQFKQERTRVFGSERKTTYEERRKKGILMCKECGSTFMNGRWSWDPAPLEAKLSLCPACQRIRDQYPAGILTLAGTFTRNHLEEIRNLIQNVAEAEQADHPMERVMGIQRHKHSSNSEMSLEVLTTGSHLARRIGEALNSAYEGELSIDYNPETFVRVSWVREE